MRMINRKYLCLSYVLIISNFKEKQISKRIPKACSSFCTLLMRNERKGNPKKKQQDLYLKNSMSIENAKKNDDMQRK